MEVRSLRVLMTNATDHARVLDARVVPQMESEAAGNIQSGARP